MMHQIKIAIDLDGGDLGFEPVIEASISFVESHPDATLLCYGVRESIASIKKDILIKSKTGSNLLNVMRQ